MKHKIVTKDREGNQIFINICLDDECKNGHQDFAITAEAYTKGKPANDRNWLYGGCCHEEILAVRPDLKLFVDLHLCDYDGVPMHAVANGFYFLEKGFERTSRESPDFPAKFCDYYRVTPDQFTALAASKSKIQFALALHSLGILDQWKAQAAKGIAKLEEVTGEKFINTSTRSQLVMPTEAEIQAENEKIASGYYTAEAEDQRKVAKLQAAVDKIESNFQAEITKLRHQADIKKQILQIAGIEAEKNSIVYWHTKTVKFNIWDWEKPVSRETIDKIEADIRFPEGYKIDRTPKTR